MAQAWPRAVRIAIVLAIAALVVVLTLSFRRDPRDIRSGTVGKPAAAFALQKLDGSGELRVEPGSRVYVLNFWASWCIPCKEENPALVRTYERYRGSDVVFVGVLYQDTLENGIAYVRDNGVTWPTVNDENGRVAFSYGVRGIPETFFIGRDGIVAGRHYGPIDEATLTRGIECVRGSGPAVECLRGAVRR